MKSLSYILILLAIVLSSCEKIIEIDIEDAEVNLVVNALFNNDSLWKVEISQSKHVFDTSNIKMVNDATVTIKSSTGNEILLTYDKNGMYISQTDKPIQGETYSLEVLHSTLENVNAISSLPSPVQFTNLELGGKYFINGEENKELKVNFIDSQQEDYYMLKCSALFWYWEFDSNLTVADTSYYEASLSFMTNSTYVSENGLDYYRNYILFSDEYFNGSEVSVNLLIPENNFIQDTVWGYGIDKLYVSLSTISKDYKLYQTSYDKYLSIQGDPFAQPVQVYTNINNGFGIFAGISTTKDSIAIK